MVSSLILLRSLRAYILKQLFFSISVNSGFGNIYLAAFAARQIFSHYSPRFQRIIVKYLYILQRLWLQRPGGGGRGGGVLWISSDGDGKGTKVKNQGLPTEPKQIAIPKTNPQKSYAKFLASH